MKKTVVTITDENYLVGTYVMLYSLLKNGGVDNLTIHIMISNKTKAGSYEITQKLWQIADATGKKIDIITEDIDFSKFSGNTLDFYKNALAKLAIFENRENHDEFLFIDSDMVILDDISQLFELKSDFSACVDMGTPREFNTGLMYIKKPYLGKEIYDKMIQSSKENFSYRGDQEHVNSVIGSYNRLPNKYNTLKDQYRHLGSWILGVKILHYISKKPWTPYHPHLHKKGNLEYLAIEKVWMKYFKELKSKVDLDYVFFKDRTELIKHVAELHPEGYGVEVGVQEGKFSKIILDNWNCETLFLVDPWEEHKGYQHDAGAVSQEEHDRNLNNTIENTSEHYDRIDTTRDYSINAADEFHEESLDFVYLDARHDKKGIKEDIEAWWPLVKKGGILAGHDYTDLKWEDNHIEVKGVVDKFFEKVNYTLDGPYPSWWVKKT